MVARHADTNRHAHRERSPVWANARRPACDFMVNGIRRNFAMALGYTSVMDQRPGGFMANIIDYLNWRGDITFDERPINDVDNITLATFP